MSRNKARLAIGAGLVALVLGTGAAAVAMAGRPAGTPETAITIEIKYSHFNPSAITHSPAGTATFTFANGNAGTFAYTVNLQDGNGPVTQTKAITRQVFRPPGTVCQ